MSSVNYDACPQDHQGLLILLAQIGSKIPSRTFKKVYERLSKLSHVKIQDTQNSGSQRGVWIKYTKGYSVENNDWGDFQAYRKVLGLISVGKCSKESELQDLCCQHNVLQERYSSTLFDSRCLVFGLNPLDPQIVSPVEEEQTSSMFVPQDIVSSEDSSSPDSNPSDQAEDRKPSGECEVQTEVIDHADISLVLKEDRVSLPEKDRQSSSSSNSSSTDSFPNSPSEPLSPVGNTNTQSSHKVLVPSASIGPGVGGNKRNRSVHCVLYASLEESEGQMEQDLLEFVSSLFWVLESKRFDRSSEKQEKLPLLKAPFEKKDMVGLDLERKTFRKKCQGRLRKQQGDLCLQAGLPVEALTKYASATDTLRSVSDWLWLASAYEGQCVASILLLHPSHQVFSQQGTPGLQRYASVPAHGTGAKSRPSNLVGPSRSLPTGLDPSDIKALGKNILTQEEITGKYKDAVMYYSKYGSASAVGIECCIKAARAHIIMENYLTAAEFVQSVVFVGIPETEEDKLNRFSALCDLYSELGFHRKAAFFKWISATQYASLQGSNISQCYHLLLQTLSGYRLTLDPKEFMADPSNGWPGVQIKLLLDLVAIAKRMGNQPLAVRHMSFLLHTMFKHLSQAERKEFCTQLETLAAKCEGGPVPLALDSGFIIPPVNLLHLPIVKTFTVQSLAPHLRPLKTQPKEPVPDKMGPFIFSPFMIYKEQSQKNQNQLSFKWVEGDVCEVALQVFNPLPFELRVTHMGLMADGVAFESFPACLSLPAESGPYPVHLLGTPRATGELQILGYTTHVLGVKSNCRLRDLSNIRVSHFSVDVIPSLPQIQLACPLPKASTFSSLADAAQVVISASCTLFAGESRECVISLTNIGSEPLEKVDVLLQSELTKDQEQQLFTWNKELLDKQLPVAPGNSICFTLNINVMFGFLQQKAVEVKPEPNQGSGSRKSNSSPLGSTPANSPHLQKGSGVISPEPYPTKMIEVLIQLQYTGGSGMKAGYFRQCAMALTVEVLPSLVITKWDVIPAEIATHCYLVLDVLNATNSEMELQYAANKEISIEAQDVCRIPVPVVRCPLSLAVNPDTHKLDVAKCHNHLVNLVHLQWTLPCSEITGLASIAEVKWTTNMLDVIVMSPIQWEILLGGQPFNFEEEFSYKIGDLITLSIVVNNITESTLESLCLRIQGFQDYQNGQRTYRLEGKRTVVGSDRVLIDRIAPDDRYQHDCGMVFFHAGLYKLDIQCSCPAYSGHSTSSIKPSAVGYGYIDPSEQPSVSYIAGKQQQIAETLPTVGHTWRCTPSVELTITRC